MGGRHVFVGDLAFGKMERLRPQVVDRVHDGLRDHLGKQYLVTKLQMYVAYRYFRIIICEVNLVKMKSGHGRVNSEVNASLLPSYSQVCSSLLQASIVEATAV